MEFGRNQTFDFDLGKAEMATGNLCGSTYFMITETTIFNRELKVIVASLGINKNITARIARHI